MNKCRKIISRLNDIQIKNNNARPKCRPYRAWADIKYYTFLVLTYLYNRRIGAQIKERRNAKPKQGRPHVFLYREYRKVRSSVERFFGWLISFRRIQTRYERLASTYLGFIQLGCIMILMKVVRWVCDHYLYELVGLLSLINVITNDFKQVKDWILISNFNNIQMNYVFRLPVVCSTSSLLGHLNHCVQIHLNQPNLAIVYRLNSRCIFNY